MPTDFLTVLAEFQERNIRYVPVGGLAVLLHGVKLLGPAESAPDGWCVR